MLEKSFLWLLGKRKHLKVCQSILFFVTRPSLGKKCFPWALSARFFFKKSLTDLVKGEPLSSQLQALPGVGDTLNYSITFFVHGRKEVLSYPAVLSKGDMGPRSTGRVHMGSLKNSSTHRRQNSVSSDLVNPLK